MVHDKYRRGRLILPARVLDILREAAAKQGLTVDLMREHGQQSRPFTAARREAADRLLALGLSVSAVGRYLNVHHTSVLHYKRLTAKEPNQATSYRDWLVSGQPDESGTWAI